jgi:hypothetical protein
MGGGSIHVDIEHPIFGQILQAGEQTFCQGKGDHGIFITLDASMAGRAAPMMRMRTDPFDGNKSSLTARMVEMLDEIADLLEITGDDYRPIAYRRAARNLERTSLDLLGLVESGELTSIHGIGQSISSLIREYIETGSMGYLEELRVQVPVFPQLLELHNMDVRTAKSLHEKLGVRDIDELGRIVEEGRLILGPQPTTLEDKVKLQVFLHWSGKYSEVLNTLYAGLSSIEPLRRRFGPKSITYDVSLGGASHDLLVVNPLHEGGIELIVLDTRRSSGEIPSLIDRLTEFPGETGGDGETGILLGDSKSATCFTKILGEWIREVYTW